MKTGPFHLKPQMPSESTKSQKTSAIKALFDTSFSEIVALRIMPWIYGLAILSLIFAELIMAIKCFHHSLMYGILYLLMSPVIFILGLLIIRLILELFFAILRMQSLMMDMNAGLQGLDDHMKNLSQHMASLNQHIDQMSHHIEYMRKDFSNMINNIDDLTDRIPFLKKSRKQE